MKKLTLFLSAMLLACATNLWAADTYEQLTSIASIDETAQYVLGIEGTGFHYSGTSSWGLTALPTTKTPIYYTLKSLSQPQPRLVKKNIIYRYRHPMTFPW